MKAHLFLAAGSLILSLTSVACVLDPASIDESDGAVTTEAAEDVSEVASELDADEDCVDDECETDGAKADGAKLDAPQQAEVIRSHP